MSLTAEGAAPRRVARNTPKKKKQRKRLSEAEAQRRREQSERDLAAFRDDDYAVLTFPAWCRLKGISESTGRRLRRTGRGPPFIWLSARRLGITRKADREWTEALKSG